MEKENKMKIYLSCPIRGIRVTPENYGTPEADEIVRENCFKAMRLADTLRRHLPDTEIHCPANWNLETFVGIAYKGSYLTEEQILDIDCKIIADSDFVLFYNHEEEFGKGMQTEFDYVNKNNIPYSILYEIGRIADYIDYLRIIRRIRDDK